MSKEQVKKLTLAQAVERAQQSQNDKLQLFDLESDFLGGALPGRRLPVDQVLKLMDDNKSESLQKNVDFHCMLIVKHVPILQDDEFLKDYATPVMAVKALYHDNAGEIMRHGNMILGQYGIVDLDDLVKN